MISPRWLLVLSLVSGVGVLWTAGIAAALAAGVRPVAAPVAIAVAAALTVPAFVAGILANRRGYQTTEPRRLWRLASWVPPHVPHWAAALAAVLFFGFWLTIVLAFAALEGTPEMRDGRTVLTEGDRVTEVSRSVYDRQLDHELQISLGVLGAFAVGGTFLSAARATHPLD